MSRVLSAAFLAAAFTARYPNAGKLDGISASAETKLDAVDAAASVKGFAAFSGKLTWVKAASPFFVKGELVTGGTFVQVPANTAKRLIAAQQATAASDADVAAAQAADATDAKGVVKAKA